MNSTSKDNLLYSLDQILLNKPGRYIVAAFYLFPTFIGILAASIVIRGIAKFKEFKTFIFFIVANHCATDALTLSAIGLYVGVCCVAQSAFHQNLEKMMAFVVDFGWFTSSQFLIAFSLSRMLKLKFSKFAAKYLTRRAAVAISVFAIYTPCFCLTGNDIWLRDTTLYLFGNFSTWAYNSEESKFGRFMESLSYYYYIISPMVLISMNSVSVYYLKKARSSVAHDQAQRSLRRKELKLSVQCLINSAVYSLSCFSYFLLIVLRNPYSCLFIAAHLLWILNHANSAIVYFVFNDRIRRTIFH